MRLLKLKLNNFTSFKGEHQIDFSAISDDDLFAIVGPTGSGKSSLLSAITMALYGSHYKKDLNQTDFVSKGSSQASAEVIFLYKNKKYRAQWVCKKLKKDGSPLKKPLLTRFLIDDQTDIILETSAQDLIGLDFEQFCKTVILNQGEFSKYLTSTFTERKSLLESLYHYQKMKFFSSTLTAKIKELRQKQELILREVDSIQSQETQTLAEIDQEILLSSEQYEDLVSKEAKRNEKIKLTTELQRLHNDYLKINEQLNTTQKNLSIQDKAILEAKLENESIKKEQSNFIADFKEKVEQFNEAIELTQHLKLLNKDIHNTNYNISQSQKKIEQKLLEINNKNNEILKLENNLTKTSLLNLEQLDELYNEAVEKLAKLKHDQKDIQLKSKEIAKLKTESINLQKDYLTKEEKYQILLSDSDTINSIINHCAHYIEKNNVKECPICNNPLSQTEINIRNNKSNIAMLDRHYQEKEKAKLDYNYKLESIENLLEQTKKNDIEKTNLAIANLQGKILDISKAKNNQIIKKDIEQIKNIINIYQSDINEINLLLPKLKDSAETINKKIKQHNLELEKLNIETDPEVLKEALYKRKDLLSEKVKNSDYKVHNKEIEITHLKSSLSLLRSSLKENDYLTAPLAKKLYESSLDNLNRLELGALLKTSLDELTSSQESRKQQITELSQEIGELKHRSKRLKDSLEKLKLLHKQNELLQTEIKTKAELLLLIGKDEFRNYVLIQLEDILTHYANKELEKLYSGRYQLCHSGKDLRDFYVIDRFALNIKRKIATLSGGELFLTSLAMALAIAELSRGEAQIESFFIDEGFGTLDEESLEQALDALYELRNTGKQIGLISHRSELKERIFSKIQLTKNIKGLATIELVN